MIYRQTFYLQNQVFNSDQLDFPPQKFPLVSSQLSDAAVMQETVARLSWQHSFISSAFLFKCCKYPTTIYLYSTLSHLSSHIILCIFVSVQNSCYSSYFVKAGKRFREMKRQAWVLRPGIQCFLYCKEIRKLEVESQTLPITGMCYWNILLCGSQCSKEI